MLSTLSCLGLFFKNSPKRQNCLERSIAEYNNTLKQEGKKEINKTKIKTMCQTRWVERHTSMEDLDILYPAVVHCLDLIANNTENIWDGKNTTEANGLKYNLSSAFIAAFQVNLHIFRYTKPLSVLLQGSTMDLLSAYEDIKTVKTIIADLRKKPEKEFRPIFAKMMKIATAAGIEELSVPRRCGRQTARNNVQSSSTEEYWRRAVFIPFLDHLNQEFENRFSQLSQNSIIGMKLIPDQITSISAEDEEKVIHFFNEDLPSPTTVLQELRRWKTLWSGRSEELPTSLSETLNSPYFSPKAYPNMATIFHILSITPVTVAITEQANSALKHIKSPKRSMMGQDRLNALLMLFVHKDIKLDYEGTIDLYARRFPRRMTFANPLSQ